MKRGGKPPDQLNLPSSCYRLIYFRRASSLIGVCGSSSETLGVALGSRAVDGARKGLSIRGRTFWRDFRTRLRDFPAYIRILVPFPGIFKVALDLPVK
jgi:hypothetical protein